MWIRMIGNMAISVMFIGVALRVAPPVMAENCPEDLVPMPAATSPYYCMTLNGSAKGGTLVLVPLHSELNCVYINTRLGEAPATVAKELVYATTQAWFHDISKPLLRAVGSQLQGMPGTVGSHCFAGTETGLGVPKPPLSLSATYDAKSDQFILHWINPSSQPYDSVIVPFGRRLDGATTTCVVKLSEAFYGRGIRTLYVIGVRDTVPSNAGMITVTRNSQEELESIPFSGGVAPNWMRWSLESNASGVDFEQGVKAVVQGRKRRGTGRGSEVVDNSRRTMGILDPAEKQFFQLVKTRTATAQAGVWRKFLGLTPGHTYRVYARLNSMDMDAAKGEWLYSLHAAYNAPNSADFNVDQFSGKRPLPDGTKGASAGRIAHYGPGATTKGKWIECSTGNANSETKDITLPEGVDTITLWVCHSGANSTGVGIDWVKIEDVTK